MIDNIYRNAFKEVYEILENTEKDLIKKIPNEFIEFLKNNMNKEYQTNISVDLPLDKQPLLKETEYILALIFRSYWAEEKEKKEKYSSVKNIDEIFKKRKNLNNIKLTTDLTVIKKENFLQRLFYKILNLFKK